MLEIVESPPRPSLSPSAKTGDVVVELGDFQSTTALALARAPTLTAAQLYINLPLDEGKRDIRVLDIDGDPSQGSEEETPLTGQLRVVSLATSPRFAAVSYVWGDYSEPRSVITCNGGCRLEITDNCRDALLALRRQFGAVTVWVDAICINQDPSATEKLLQIQLMEEIYSWAECTYVWLGPGDKTCDRAIDWFLYSSVGTYVDEVIQYASAPTPSRMRQEGWKLLKTIICDHSSRNTQGLKAFVSFVFRKLRMLHLYGKIRKLFKPLPSEIFWPGYEPETRDTLFARPWFYRAWTFQEFLLSPSLTFLCGERRIPWSRLVSALERLSSYPEFYSGEGQHTRNMQDLVTVWMNVSRPVSWNGCRLRREWPEGTTPRVYQKKGQAMLQKRYDIRIALRAYFLVYCGIGGILAFILIFLLGLPGALTEEARSPIPINSMKTLGITACILGMLLGGPGLIYVLGMVLGPRFHVFPRLFLGRTLDDERTSKNIYLSGIIQAIRERGATDPKDRSFASYGVLRRLGVSLSGADYSKTRGRIYQDLLADLIQWQPSMVNLILDAGIGSRFTDAPSWVPDWDTASGKCYFDTNCLYYKNSETNATLDWESNATVNGDSLHVTGVWIGMAELSCGPFNSVEESTAQHFIDNDAAWKGVLGLADWVQTSRRTATMDYTSLPQSIYRVLCSFLKKDGVDGEDTHASVSREQEREGVANVDTAESDSTTEHEFDAAFRFLNSIDMKDLDVEGNVGNQNRELLQDNIHTTQTLAYITKVINQLASGRRTVFTSREGYVGCGPVDISSGDRIALLFGVAFPLVLREKQVPPSETASIKTYEVVGPAYIDGYMRGEAAYKAHLYSEPITLV